MSQLTKSWAHRILHMYIEANGFGSNDFRNDCITKLFYAMIPLNLLYPCLEICGLYISVSSSQFNPITVLLQFQYLLFFIGVNVIVIFDYTFFKQRLLACIMHVKRVPRCISWTEEALEWRANDREVKLFVLCFLCTLYPAAFIATIVSPGVRFGLSINSTFIVFPVWYPCDVMARPAFFWTAYVCETVMIWLAAHYVVSNNFLFIYIVMSTRLRFNILANYFGDITTPKMWKFRNSRHSTGDVSGMSLVTNINKDVMDIILVHPEQLTEFLKSKRLIDGLMDLLLLRRQRDLINNAWQMFLNSCDSVTMLSNALMTFAATYEIRNSGGKAAVDVMMFTSYFLGSILVLFSVCHFSTLLQDAHDNLLVALWGSEWTTDGIKFKKLFFLSMVSLRRPFVLKFYSHYPINLKGFAKVSSHEHSRSLSF
ncbi:unnamed protein product [Bemisia tabaci]|uniref:Odorant receptor n=1 Tax=Bemisia tabaci TaxID=7038 RepID=A0A9P0A1M8_BEMTA|nr:unnamed protein product [Bemisia tabaci]